MHASEQLINVKYVHPNIKCYNWFQTEKDKQWYHIHTRCQLEVLDSNQFQTDEETLVHLVCKSKEEEGWSRMDLNIELRSKQCKLRQKCVLSGRLLWETHLIKWSLMKLNSSKKMIMLAAWTGTGRSVRNEHWSIINCVNLSFGFLGVFFHFLFCVLMFLK